MVDKEYYTWQDIEHMTNVIINALIKDNFKPDYIVGLTRGGLVPATIMSNQTGIPMQTLDVRFRDMSSDYDGPERNKKMKRNAFDRKKILVIDDINDTGTTMAWIKSDWDLDTLESIDPFNDNVRFAALIDNTASNFDIDYSAHEINKMEHNVWIVFPWEGEKHYGIA